MCTVYVCIRHIEKKTQIQYKMETIRNLSLLPSKIAHKIEICFGFDSCSTPYDRCYESKCQNGKKWNQNVCTLQVHKAKSGQKRDWIIHNHTKNALSAAFSISIVYNRNYLLHYAGVQSHRNMNFSFPVSKGVFSVIAIQLTHTDKTIFFPAKWLSDGIKLWTIT